MNDRNVVIAGAVRTPIGQFLGTLRDFSIIDLGAIVVREVLKRSGVPSASVDEVIMGCIMQTEPLGNPAREVALHAGIPFTVPAFTVNKNCASSIKSITLGAASILSGENELVVAGGMESMSNAPYLLRQARTGYRFGHAQIYDFLAESLEGMGLTAENLAARYNINREQQDLFAYESQMKAVRYHTEKKHLEEIVAISIPQKKKESLLFDFDEGIKSYTTLEKLGTLKPAFKEGGTVTPGNSSTINDGAAALVLTTDAKMKELKLKPLARIKDWVSVGCEPEIMGIGPVSAIRKLCEKNSMRIDDFDLIELNEAFAVQALSVIKEVNIDNKKCNVNGGAIAHGHPVGATGAILITKLVYEMKRRNVKNGLVSMCVGGGQGIALFIENCTN